MATDKARQAGVVEDDDRDGQCAKPFDMRPKGPVGTPCLGGNDRGRGLVLGARRGRRAPPGGGVAGRDRGGQPRRGGNGLRGHVRDRAAVAPGLVRGRHGGPRAPKARPKRAAGTPNWPPRRYGRRRPWPCTAPWARKRPTCTKAPGAFAGRTRRRHQVLPWQTARPSTTKEVSLRG